MKISTWADIPKEANREREYRRGYRDGFIKAANLVFDIWFMRDKQRIYDVMCDHYENSLLKWVTETCDGVISPPEVEGAKCVYCGARAEHTDHVIPKSRGGSDDISNLVSSCAKCNIEKRDRTPDEWIEKARDGDD